MKNRISAPTLHRSFLRSAGRLVALAGAVSLISALGEAQGTQGPLPRTQPAPARPRPRALDSIPAQYRPPAGMCRVWVDGVPPAQQPAPTDCPTAALKMPANGRVIYGDDRNKGKGGKNEPRLPIKGFTPPKNPVNAAIPETGSREVRDPRMAREVWESKRVSDEQLFGDRPATQPASSYPGAPIPGGVLSGGAVANGTVGGSGILGDPRYFNNNAAVTPPGYKSGACLDRDQDGWCDDLRFGPPVCLDQDKDGRCDDLPEYASQAYPQTLPHMRGAQDVIEGRGSVEVARWLGTNEFTVRVPDQGRGGTPWRAIFLDARGELLQVWTDRNHDGLAERVEVFRGGQRVKLIQR